LCAESDREGRRRGRYRWWRAVAACLRARPSLRLGPPASNPQTPPHRQTLAELKATLERLFDVFDHLGGPTARSRWVRLHEFSEAYEAAPVLRAYGIEALFTTDKPAIAWRLPPAERDVLQPMRRVHSRAAAFAGAP